MDFCIAIGNHTMERSTIPLFTIYRYNNNDITGGFLQGMGEEEVIWSTLLLYPFLFQLLLPKNT
jgi:hypothetical protein